MQQEDKQFKLMFVSMSTKKQSRAKQLDQKNNSDLPLDEKPKQVKFVDSTKKLHNLVQERVKSAKNLNLNLQMQQILRNEVRLDKVNTVSQPRNIITPMVMSKIFGDVDKRVDDSQTPLVGIRKLSQQYVRRELKPEVRIL